MILYNVIYLLVSNDSSGAKIIAMGIIGGLFFMALLAFSNIKDSGITTRKGRSQNKSKKKLEWIEKQISELKIARHRNILTEEEFESKISELKCEKRDLLIEYYLKNDDKYQSIMDAYKKRFINEAQKEAKLNEIRERIRLHIGN